MSDYIAFCDEHNIPLQPNGSCKWCRDSEGNTFPLDMQSTYLLKKGYPFPEPTPNGYPDEG